MKKLRLAIAFCLSCTLVHAQDQFTNTGNFQVLTGASVTFFGNFSNDGTVVDGGQTITFKGTSSQIIRGSAVTTFNNLVLDNAAGIALQQNATVANTLVLTSGQVNLNANTLTITNTDPLAVTRTSGYILSEQTDNSSKVKWNIGANTVAHVFPFGTSAGTYIPFTLQVTAGNIGNVTVSTYPTAANNTPYPSTPTVVSNVNRMGSDNSANVVDRFWQIDKDGASGTANLTFQATATEVGPISTLRAQRWDGTGSKWEDPLAGQSSSATGVTVFGVTAFSPWTLSGNNAPLPIEFMSFTATAIKTDVDLNWKTAMEVNNDHFVVQRSQDGIEFTEVAKVKAAAASKEVQQYNYLDLNALPGKSYYRLKQTDLDGAFKYSEIRMVNVEASSPGITAYPNPVTNGKVSLDFTNVLESATYITVYDLVGKIVLQEVIEEGVREYTLNLDNVPTGAYVIKGLNGKSVLQQTIIVK
jgi:hypothetical protein